jgi:hypothetical protein
MSGFQPTLLHKSRNSLAFGTIHGLKRQERNAHNRVGGSIGSKPLYHTRAHQGLIKLEIMFDRMLVLKDAGCLRHEYHNAEMSQAMAKNKTRNISVVA